MPRLPVPSSPVAAAAPRPRWLLLALVLGAALTAAAPGCRGETTGPQPAAQVGGPASAVLTVAVTVMPQQYFVRRLAGDRAAVQVLLPPGVNHEEYEPSVRFLTSLSQARLWFQVGPQLFSFEQAWAGKILAAAPQLKPVDTSVGVPLVDHNPHLWLSPRAVKVQARTIAAALAAADPADRAGYDARLAAFELELDALDAELTTILAPARGKTFVIFHPSWTYFAHDYGLQLLPIEDHGHDPGPGRLEQVVGQARQAGARDVFVEPLISSRSASTVAESLGGGLVVIDPLAADWPASLRAAARSFAERSR